MKVGGGGGSVLFGWGKNDSISINIMNYLN